MLQLKKFKRGDTLQLSGIYRIGGVPASLESYTVRSQIKKNGILVATFNVVIPNQNQLSNIGLFNMSISASETSLWTPGLYICDLEFSTGGVVRSTETFEIPVIDGVTE